MAQVKIVEAVEVVTTDKARLGKMDLWVTYTLDGAGPYMAILPKEGYTEAKLADAIRASQAERAKLVGKTINL
jgi:hypothetical protein